MGSLSIGKFMDISYMPKNEIVKKYQRPNHTPAPWQVNGNPRVKIATITKPATMNGIDWQANSCLIAAAPELLAALKEVLDLELPEGALDNTLAQMAIDKALKAINKAGGNL